MTYMKRNVNLLLMLLVMIVLLSIVILVVFYQDKYQELTKDHRKIKNELNQTNHTLSSKMEELSKTSTELKVSSSDKEHLDDLYTQLTNEKESLARSLNLSKQSLKRTTDELVGVKRKLASAENTVFEQNQTANRLMLKINRLEDDIDDLEEEVCRLKRRLNIRDNDC